MKTVSIPAATARWHPVGNESAVNGRPPSGIAMIPCTPRQLEVFLTAAEDCHFVCTASRLGISQAAVSSHIAALEHQLGKPLFVRRRGRKPILSNYGHSLFSEAHAAITQTDGGDVRARPQNLRRRRVHVGAGGHLLDDYIRPRLTQFYRQHADLDIECHYIDSPNPCVQLINERKIDLLAYTVTNPANFPLHAEILRSVRLGLYVGRGLASSRSLSPAELSRLPFILPPEGSPACRIVQSALLAAGISCRSVAAYVQFAPVAKDLAKRGHGVAALLETMVTPKETRELVELDVEMPTLYRTLFRANREPDAAILSAESFLRETLSR